jgi:hypothetical protein
MTPHAEASFVVVGTRLPDGGAAKEAAALGRRNRGHLKLRAAVRVAEAPHRGGVQGGDEDRVRNAAHQREGCAPSGWAFVVPMELSATFKPIDDGSVAIL